MIKILARNYVEYKSTDKEYYINPSKIIYVDTSKQRIYLEGEKIFQVHATNWAEFCNNVGII